MRYLLLLPLLCFLSCDPDDDVVIDNEETGLVGDWRAVAYSSNSTYVSIDGQGDSTVTRQVARLIEPTTYVISFSDNPEVINSSGYVTFERTSTYASGRVDVDKIASEGAFRNVTWKRTGDTFVTTDPDGESLENKILSLTERQLIFSYSFDAELFDGFFARGKSTYTFERQ